MNTYVIYWKNIQCLEALSRISFIWKFQPMTINKIWNYCNFFLYTYSSTLFILCVLLWILWSFFLMANKTRKYVSLARGKWWGQWRGEWMNTAIFLEHLLTPRTQLDGFCDVSFEFKFWQDVYNFTTNRPKDPR